jgi:hypothetical protein
MTPREWAGYVEWRELAWLVFLAACCLVLVSGCVESRATIPEAPDATVHETPEPTNTSWCNPCLTWAGPVGCSDGNVYYSSGIPCACSPGAPCVAIPLHGEPELGTCRSSD